MKKIAFVCNQVLMLALIISITYCAVYFNNVKILFWYILVALMVMSYSPERKDNEEKE